MNQLAIRCSRRAKSDALGRNSLIRTRYICTSSCLKSGTGYVDVSALNQACQRSELGEQ